MSAVAAALPTLRLDSGRFKGQTYELRGTLRVGRHPFNEISLPDLSVSRYHCWFSLKEDRVVLEDLASANGTFVNGDRLREPRALKPGDRVLIGNTQLVFGGESTSTILLA
jgi:pSer/pThr/pTyr-binding forkhead associated (FHA) protein